MLIFGGDFMDESKLWKDIATIASSTGRTEVEVYIELINEFKELVAQRLEESYDTGRPKLKINEAEFRKLYQSEMPINDLIAHFKISRSSVRNLRIKYHLPKRRYMVKYDKKRVRATL
jgi:uncharacterized protein YdcH (DUF465 family)